MSRPAGTGDGPEPQNEHEGRVLGVDLGRRRVGLAISDSERRVASPLSVLARELRMMTTTPTWPGRWRRPVPTWSLWAYRYPCRDG